MPKYRVMFDIGAERIVFAKHRSSAFHKAKRELSKDYSKLSDEEGRQEKLDELSTQGFQNARIVLL